MERFPYCFSRIFFWLGFPSWCFCFGRLLDGQHRGEGWGGMGRLMGYTVFAVHSFDNWQIMFDSSSCSQRHLNDVITGVLEG